MAEWSQAVNRNRCSLFASFVVRIDFRRKQLRCICLYQVRNRPLYLMLVVLALYFAANVYKSDWTDNFLLKIRISSTNPTQNWRGLLLAISILDCKLRILDVVQLFCFSIRQPKLHGKGSIQPDETDLLNCNGVWRFPSCTVHLWLCVHSLRYAFFYLGLHKQRTWEKSKWIA